MFCLETEHRLEILTDSGLVVEKALGKNCRHEDTKAFTKDNIRCCRSTSPRILFFNFLPKGDESPEKKERVLENCGGERKRTNVTPR